MRRDLAGLAEYGAMQRPDLCVWDAFSDLAALTARDLRRKLGVEDLRAIEARLTEALDAAREELECSRTEETSTSDVRFEQHHQNSKKDSYESEPAKNAGRGGDGPNDDAVVVAPDSDYSPTLPLPLVLSACPEIQSYSEQPVCHWHELVRLAGVIRPMLGISPDAWTAAVAAMGPENASVVLAAMLERLDAIRAPGGYLRALTTKAEGGAFSPGPMVMALLRREAA